LLGLLRGDGHWQQQQQRGLPHMPSDGDKHTQGLCVHRERVMEQGHAGDGNFSRGVVDSIVSAGG